MLHHVRTLVERGFLVPEPARRGTRGAREMPYRATGRSLHAGGAGLDRVVVDSFLEELALADPATVSTARMGVRLDAAARRGLQDRLDALLLEFHDRVPGPDAEPYSVFVALHGDPTRDAAQRP